MARTTRKSKMRSPDYSPSAGGQSATLQQTSNGMRTSSHDSMKYQPRGGSPMVDKNGAVTITLHTTKDNFDETAEVKVELANPEQVVEKMLTTLAHKFPPESVMTIAAGSVSDTDSETTIITDSSPVVANQFSGRHYLGPNGEYYPELADAKGRPIVGYVRDPRTGGALPVGRAAYGPDGHPLSGMIIGPTGKPIPGVAVPFEGLDSNGNPCPFYEAIDGTYPREAVRGDGRALLGFAIDPATGEMKRVGPAVLGPDGYPMPNVIRGPNGDVMPGIPLKPVQRPNVVPKPIAPPRRPLTHTLPCYTTLDGRKLSVATDPEGRPLLGFAKDPRDGIVRPVGMPLLDHQGRPVPGFILGPDGRPMEGIPIVKEGSAHRSTPEPIQPPPPHRPRPTPPAEIAVKLPAPSYPLLNGGYAKLAVGQDGRPMDGYAEHPVTGEILPVGLPYVDSRGHATGEIIGKNGQPIRGLPVGPHGWDNATDQALPHYLTAEGHWVPMSIDPSGHLSHGWARDTDGKVKPVGLQAMDQDGRPIAGWVVGPDGRRVQGIALNTMESRSVPVSSPRPAMDPDGCVVRYVEVPIVEEKIIHVKGPREFREVPKEVPHEEIVEVVKEVQVETIEYRDKVVEVPEYVEVTREVPIKQVVDRPYEVVFHQRKIEQRLVEKIVEVPGQVVEVPRVERREQPVYVPKYVDKEVPTVVAQKVQPVVRQTSEVRSVPCTVTEPKIITVDVFIPKPVVSNMGFSGKLKETHNTVDIPAAQFNALTKRLNASLDPSHISALLVKEGAGIPILPVGERVETVEPVANDWAQSHQIGKIHCSTATEFPQINVQETIGLPTASQPYYVSRGLADTEDFESDPALSHRMHRRRRAASMSHDSDYRRDRHDRHGRHDRHDRRERRRSDRRRRHSRSRAERH